MEDVEEEIFFYNFKIDVIEDEKNTEEEIQKQINSEKNREKYKEIILDKKLKLENKIKNKEIIKKKWKQKLRQNKKNNLREKYNKMTSQERKKALKEKRDKNSKTEKEKLKNNLIKNLNKGLSINIDLYYTEKMSLKECNSLGSQIAQCYSITKKNKNAMNLGLINYNEKIKEILTKKFFSDKWIINFYQKNILDLKNKKKIIYLSPDSEENLKEINDDFFFIIGGLVDGQVIKNCSKNRAFKLGVECRKLPLKEAGIDLVKMRSILNVNMVFDMLCKAYFYKDLKKGIRMSVSDKYLL